jgi:hypothetical protein
MATEINVGKERETVLCSTRISLLNVPTAINAAIAPFMADFVSA